MIHKITIRDYVQLPKVPFCQGEILEKKRTSGNYIAHLHKIGGQKDLFIIYISIQLYIGQRLYAHSTDRARIYQIYEAIGGINSKKLNK